MARRRCNSARAAASSLRNSAHLVLQPALSGHQFGAALADGFHQKQTRLRLHRLGTRTHKIAINSYPIQRPLWTALRTSSRTSRDVREWDGPAALPPPTVFRVRRGLVRKGAPPCPRTTTLHAVTAI